MTAERVIGIAGDLCAAQRFEDLIGRVIRARRIALGLTQGVLAQRIGTGRPLVARAEKGKHALSLLTLRRYARALDCEASDLLREAEARESDRNARAISREERT